VHASSSSSIIMTASQLAGQGQEDVDAAQIFQQVDMAERGLRSALARWAQ
jgi:hypothetical protein